MKISIEHSYIVVLCNKRFALWKKKVFHLNFQNALSSSILLLHDLDNLSYINRVKYVEHLDLAYEKFVTALKMLVHMSLDSFA